VAGKANPKQLRPAGNDGSGRGGSSSSSSNGGGTGRAAAKIALAGVAGLVGKLAATRADGRHSRSPMRKALDKVKP
jgi:hypothetical protein